MGLFNTYDGVQLKVSKTVSMAHFNRGDFSDLPDGVYLGWDGIVVIHNKKVLRSYPTITTSHGTTITAKDLFVNSLAIIDQLKDIME